MPVPDYKMHGATPTGRSRAYTYDTTIQKVKDTRLSISITTVEEQIADLLHGIRVDPHVLPQLQRLYREQVDAPMAYAPQLFGRLETNDLNKLLRILFRRIIIDMRGKVVDFDLNPPFVYLSSLNKTPSHGPHGCESMEENQGGSRQFQSALPRDIFHKELPTEEVGQFASMVSFPQRGQLDGLLRQSGENIWPNSAALEG